MTKAILRRAN